MEATNRYTAVVKKQGKLLSSYSIGRYKALLENYSFCQVHRSFIVNLNHVSRYEHSGMIVMTNGAEIPISRQHKADFLQRFEQREKQE
jgi:two-component system LytT family response regulator